MGLDGKGRQMETSARSETSVLIDRPVDEVFSYVSNRENDAEWRDEVKSVKRLTPPPDERGSRYLETVEFDGVSADLTLEVTQYLPNEQIQFEVEATGKKIKAIFGFHGEPYNSVTRVTFQTEADVGGPQGLLDKMLDEAVTRYAQRDLGHLKSLLEERDGL